MAEPRKQRAELQFCSDEITVDAKWFGSSLFSLTDKGLLSEWTILQLGFVIYRAIDVQINLLCSVEKSAFDAG